MIASWFNHLLQIDRQFRSWLNSGRPHSFWLSGFSNPPGFLTAMQQEVARKHRSQQWALDEMRYHTEVTQFKDVSVVNAAPAEGAYIHGLTMDGAALDIKAGMLVESQPKILLVPLPVLFVTVNHFKEQVTPHALDHGHCPFAATSNRVLCKGFSIDGHERVQCVALVVVGKTMDLFFSARENHE